MKKILPILSLYALSLFSCVNKQDNAAEAVKQAFPELKNAVKSVEPSRFGDFGILLEDPSGQNKVSAYIMGTDLNGDKDLQKPEVEKVYISIMDPRETHERGIIASLKENDTTYMTGISESNSPDFPLQKNVVPSKRVRYRLHGFFNIGKPQKSFDASLQDMATNGVQMLNTAKDDWQRQIDGLKPEVN